MKQRDFGDLGRMMDQIFSAAEDLGAVFGEKTGFDPREKGFNWDAQWDFYPSYSYPPVNIYMSDDKTMVFEFALAGFRENDINLQFKGDYMMLSATPPPEMEPDENVHFLKRRLKVKPIHDQRYYVPEDKFDREASEAVFKNGILRVTIPPKERPDEEEGYKITITKEDEE
jgi:molecular chaperone IbpB/HSP20 family protein